MLRDTTAAFARLRNPERSMRAGLGLDEPSAAVPSRQPNQQASMMLQQQQEAIEQQDVSLDILLASVERQKEMGIAISNELDQQSGLLDELDDGMETTGMTVNRQQSRLEEYMKQAAASGNTCIILGLSAVLMVLTMLALDII